MINTAALPLIAILRKGAEMTKADNGKTRPGRDLDHFRVDFSPEFEHHAAAFERLYGKDPATLSGVRFLDDEPFSFFYERWGGNQTLQVRHDGRVYLKRWTPEGYDYTHAPVDSRDLDSEVCQPRGRMAFLLEDFFRETGEVGLFMALTSSEIDRDTIQTYLGFMGAMQIPLTGMAFTLRRVAREFTVEIKGKPSRVTKFMWQLTANAGMVRAALPSRTDPVTGEITGGNRPALTGGPEPRTLTQDELYELREFTKDTGCTKNDLLLALDVSDITRWLHADPKNEAMRRLEAWIDRQISRHADEQDQSDAVTDDGDAFQPALIIDHVEADNATIVASNYSENA